MTVYRIFRRPFARDPLSGKGGLLVSGRWHSRGRLVVYASSSLSLALLEILVHVDSDLIPEDLLALTIEIPDGVPTRAVKLQDLPKSWRRTPSPPVLRQMGDEWLDRCRELVLWVPSAVVPAERNALINPRYSDAGKIRVIAKEPLQADPRLVAKKPPKRKHSSRP